MNKHKLLFISFFCCHLFIFSQTPALSKDYAVLLQASVNETAPSITITWDTNSSCLNYRIYRKSLNTIVWGNPLATLPNTAKQYVDNNIVAGNGYEYYVERTFMGYTAEGYIYAGIKLAEVTYRRRMLLLVDSNYVNPLADQISQLQTDLVTDGWLVTRMNISRSASVKSVKNIILSEYGSDTALTAIYLLGRIPVPYSGSFYAGTNNVPNPDDHPNHGGAWPADIYYGVMDEFMWTDVTCNNDSMADPRNDNVPGDGKYDQCYIWPNKANLQVGRVDLTNMPDFAMSDTLLVQQYLNKAHKFKTGQIPVIRRGLIDDQFGTYGGTDDAFAASGWRNFSTMFGDSIYQNDYFTALKQGNYLFSYGCGPGDYTGAGGIGTTPNFNSDSINTVFTMLFGSYFGDWDNENNFLRAPLCSGPSALADVWSGRPDWYFHHMVLGKNIGYSAQLTMNNLGDSSIYGFSGTADDAYVSDYGPDFVHIALMGDPSLRLHPMKPISNLSARSSSDSLSVSLKWDSSADALNGSVVLRASSMSGVFQEIAKLARDTISYKDLAPLHGMNYYMVRAMKLEQTPSGSYYNLALGVIDSSFSKKTYTGIHDPVSSPFDVTIYPNPANGVFYMSIHYASDAITTVECYDFEGRMILARSVEQNNIQQFDFSTLAKGIYLFKISNGDSRILKKIVIN